MLERTCRKRAEVPLVLRKSGVVSVAGESSPSCAAPWPDPGPDGIAFPVEPIDKWPVVLIGSSPAFHRSTLTS
jgi:hypothetical protein